MIIHSILQSTDAIKVHAGLKLTATPPAHQLWDINTRHSFNLKSVALEPAVGVENIFNYTDDRPYNSNYATLTPGRSFYVSLLVRFKQ